MMFRIADAFAAEHSRDASGHFSVERPSVYGTTRLRALYGATARHAKGFIAYVDVVEPVDEEAKAWWVEQCL